MKPRLFVALAIATILATIFYACGGGPSTPGPITPSPSSPGSNATMFKGTIAGSGGQSGAFSITVQTTVTASAASSFRLVEALFGSIVRSVEAASFSQVSGTLNLAGGASVALEGTFDSSTNAVSLSGGGFTLTGTISGGVLSGTYTGPNGVSGVFSSVNATSNVVTPYCGTYQGTDDDGIWNVQISANGQVSGEAFPTLAHNNHMPHPQLLTGQLGGTNLTLRSSPDGLPGTGTVQNGNVNGTFQGTIDGHLVSGTFTGSAGTCSLPPPPPPATVFPFSIIINGGSASFATTLQNQTMTNGQYDFILAPGTYTISGRLSSTGFVNVNLVRHSPVNCHTPTCPGGVVPGSIQSSISCGGSDCNPHASPFCPTNPTCVAPGGLGAGTTSACAALYTSSPAGATCVPVPGDPSGTCAQQQNPYVPLDFRLQFTVDGTIASNASCP